MLRLHKIKYIAGIETKVEQNSPEINRLNYAAPPKPRRRRWIFITLCGFVGLTIALLLFDAKFMNRPHVSSLPDICASHLRQIGQGLLLYSNDNHGLYPDTLGALLLSEDIAAPVFVCPSSNDTPSPGPTTRAQADDLDAGKHASYIYLGAGMHVKDITNSMVIAYEPLSHHKTGMNVLFGDGRVEFIASVSAQVILKQVNDGQSPVYFPATRPVR